MKVTKALSTAAVGSLEVITVSSEAAVLLANMGKLAAYKASVAQVGDLGKELKETADENGMSVPDLIKLHKAVLGDSVRVPDVTSLIAK